MAETISNTHFRFMTLALKIRDIFKSPVNVLKEANIKVGDTVLDFGCGPGSYSLAAAKLSGESGKIYSLDKHPGSFVQKCIQDNFNVILPAHLGITLHRKAGDSIRRSVITDNAKINSSGMCHTLDYSLLTRRHTLIRLNHGQRSD